MTEEARLTPDDNNFYELIQSCKGKLINQLKEIDVNLNPITSSFLWLERVIEAIAEIFTKAQLEKADPIIREDERKRIMNKIGCLFWIDDDAKMAGLLVTGSVVYSELEALKQGKDPSQEGGE